MSKQNEHKNPVPTVDTIIDNNSQVLFIKRIKEPFEGKMVFPGGFIKIGETAEEAAIREVGRNIFRCRFGSYIGSIF